MYRHRPWEARRHSQEDDDRQTASLAAVAFVLLLLVCSLFLIRTLQAQARMEDCLLSGWSDCNTMAATLQ